MKKEYIIWLVLILMFICGNVMAQDSTIFKADVYKTDRPSLLVNATQTIISSEYLDLVLEPIPGKQTRWRITREEVQPDSMVLLVDDADDKTIYHGTWVNGTYHTFYKGTLSYSFTVGSYIEYKFTARKIEWFSERNTTHGRAAVSMDGGPEINLLPSSLGIDYVRGKASYTHSWPTLGDHTIKIRVLDGKSVLHDYFRIVR